MTLEGWKALNNDVIAQRIADAVLTNALARLASTYGLRLVPAEGVHVSDGPFEPLKGPFERERDALREPSSDTSPSSSETPQPPQSNP